MIAGQLTDPGVNLTSVHGLTPACNCSHEFFVTSRGGLPVVQRRVVHRVTPLAEVTFLHVNGTLGTERESSPRARVVLRMLVINVLNKFSRKHQK